MLHCPATLHLVSLVDADTMRALAGDLRRERISMVYVAPAALEVGTLAAGEFGVDVRTDPDLLGLDVPKFGRGGHPVRHCHEALDGIADLHRGENILVIGDVATPSGGAGLCRLEIGDDGWRLVD